MGWELIGGDPAPGSPDSVGGASTALAHIANIASQAKTDLVTQTGAAGIERWKGSAADAFRADVAKLPGDLTTLSDSYSSAASALSTFRTVLEQAQIDAQTELGKATRAKTDRDEAAQKHNGALLEMAELALRLAKEEGKLLLLQGEQQLSIDPGQRASLNAPIATAKSKVQRVAGDLKAAKQAADRFQGQVDEADRKLNAANKNADTIRETVSKAADTATQALRQAEKDASLPNWAQEAAQRAGAWVTNHADQIKNVLKVVQLVFTVASVIFPVAAPVLMAVNLAAAVLILETDLIKTANSSEGFTSASLWELGGDLLNVVGSAAGLSLAAGAFTAGSRTATVLTNVGKAAGYGQDGAQIGQGIAENGWKGGVLATGTVLLSRGATRAGTDAVRRAAGTGSGSATTRGALDGMTASLGTPGSRPNVVHVDTSVAPSTSRIATPPALSPSPVVVGPPPSAADAAAKEAREILEPADTWLGEKINEEGQKHLQPEIDIDLNPSQYGGMQ